jgi:hypothetical protein
MMVVMRKPATRARSVWWPPKDHFKKLLEVTCPHHSYSIKHNLKDYTMMKNFMTLGALFKGRKLGEGPGGKGMAHIPEDAEVMALFNKPSLGLRNAT